VIFLNQIKSLRIGKSLTQEELAFLSNVKLSTLQKAERGNIKKITLETALKLAKGL
jgi:transcriptional regulator with XRE-family HTH domain